MARPSLDSPSMVELVSQAKNRRKSTPPPSLSGSSRIGETVEPSSLGRSSVAPTPMHHSQPVASTSRLELEHELLKRKYSLQNQTLAKNNSIMLSKLSSMEARLSELISENVLMRRQKSFKEDEIKATLHRKLLQIEDCLYDKLDDIFKMFEDFRSLEDLPANPKLKVFQENFTSNVSQRNRLLVSPLDSFAEVKKLREVSRVGEEDEVAELGAIPEVNKVVSTIQEDAEPNSKPRRQSRRHTEDGKSRQPEFDRAVLTNELTKLDRTTQELELKDQIESRKLVTEDEQHPVRTSELRQSKRKTSLLLAEDSEPIPEQAKVLSSERRRLRRRVPNMEQHDPVASRESVPEYKQPQALTSDLDHSKGKISPLSEQVKSLAKEPVKQRSASSASQVEVPVVNKKSADVKQAPALTSEPKRLKRKSSVLQMEESVEASSTSADSREALVSSLQNDDSKTFQVYSDMPSRPRRTRKEVDYKTPSLNKKMRRETEWLVTAVGNEPMVRKKENTPDLPLQENLKKEEVAVKKESIRKPLKGLSDSDRNRAQTDVRLGKELPPKVPLGEELQSKMPLSNKAQPNVPVANRAQPGMPGAKEPEDLSIFDFDDEEENRAPPIKKTYRRRVQASDLRRHSML